MTKIIRFIDDTRTDAGQDKFTHQEFNGILSIVFRRRMSGFFDISIQRPIIPLFHILEDASISIGNN